MKLYFVTGNFNKLREVQQIIGSLLPSVKIEGVNLKVVERQLDSLEEIAAEAAREAFVKLRRPLFVEDSGLFIEALNGFPGPYSSYVYRTLGCKGVLKLMEGVENRRASFKSAIALCSAPEKILVFTGVAEGEMATEERGGGWGFDPIFIPKEGGGLTYGELGVAKNEVSHRRRALEGLAAYLSRSSSVKALKS